MEVMCVLGSRRRYELLLYIAAGVLQVRSQPHTGGSPNILVGYKLYFLNEEIRGCFVRNEITIL